ncbi:MAG: hypothetical protein GX861_00275 [Tenericutes bacterium]|nr:hypothetical protein [Mycoplasmatota bacterium]
MIETGNNYYVTNLFNNGDNVNRKGDSNKIKYTQVSLINFRKKVAKLVIKVIDKVEERKDEIAVTAYEDTVHLAAERDFLKVSSSAENIVAKYGKIVKLETLLNGLNAIHHMIDKSKVKPIKISAGQFKIFGKNTNALMHLKAEKASEFNPKGQPKTQVLTNEIVEERAGNYLEALLGTKDKIVNEVDSTITTSEEPVIAKYDFSLFEEPIKEVPLKDEDLGITTSYMGSMTEDKRNLTLEALNKETKELEKNIIPKLSEEEAAAKNDFHSSEEELKKWLEQVEITKKTVEAEKAKQVAAEAQKLAGLKAEAENISLSTKTFEDKTANNNAKIAFLQQQVADLMAGINPPLTEDFSKRR